MIVLGFDTSTRATAVGLRLPDARTLHVRDDPAEGAHPGHATRLLGMAGELLVRAGITWGQIDRVAVGLGPGRFTGLRVGVATARGLAQSLSAELVGVSTLRVLAEPAIAEGTRARCALAVIDALRGEVFAAGYAATPDAVECELELPQALGPRALGDALRQASTGRGAGWCAVGDGARRYRAELEAAGAAVPADASPLHGVDARALCEIGARAQPASSRQQLLPDYRRRPDAEGVRGAGTAGRRLAQPQASAR